MKISKTKMKRKMKWCDRSVIELFTEQMNAKKELSAALTAHNYKSCINKLASFLGTEAESFRLHQVTSAWVRQWVAWLNAQHPEHPETVDFYFRNARAMYNSALPATKGTREPTDNPFHGVRIKMMRPSKRALPISVMREFLSHSFRKQLKPLYRESFDILQFIFYANGMVFQDVYNLRWNMVNDKRHIRFLRSKTGSYIEISLVAEAWEIMQRYRCDDSSFVFPFLRMGKKNPTKNISEQSALRRVNLHAAAIGRCADLALPLSTYVMRHTWATLMLESGKPIELISQCMGHTNIQTTQIYLSRISSARVEAGVNDMLQLVRQQPVRAKNDKEQSYKCAWTPPNSQKGEIALVTTCQKEENEEKDSLGSRKKRKIRPYEKDFPFLIKKEKIPPKSF